MVYLIVVFVACLVFFFILSRFAGLTSGGLPVLMYHGVTDSGSPDNLTITTQQLDSQFRYLIKKKYSPVLLSDVVDYINGIKQLPSKPVLITFDDGYKNNYTHLYPLLQQYGIRASIFLVAGFIQSSKKNELHQNEYLRVEDIRKMRSDVVQFALHSYDHRSYNDLTLSQIEEDIQKCRTTLDQLGIPYQNCLAYTFGAYPKNDPVKRKEFFRTLEANGIQLAFRIGNRLNKFPLKDKFLIQRVDIRGDESFRRFKFILVAGRKLVLH